MGTWRPDSFAFKARSSGPHRCAVSRSREGAPLGTDVRQTGIPVDLVTLLAPRDEPSDLTIAVGIATRGRAPILQETLHELDRQYRRPDRVIICATEPADLDGIAFGPGTLTVLYSDPGLPRQRNKILDEAGDADIVVFLDDDFLPAPDYLSEMEAAFANDRYLAVATGTVIADGITGPGFSAEEGRAVLLDDWIAHGPIDKRMDPTFCGYGCNMAVRMETVRRHGVRVDERLQLYGWQEDVDFTRRLGRHGGIARLSAARGVHLGTKSGRGSGLNLGYSQIANPLYLAYKSRGGAYPLSYALIRISRNLAANVGKALTPEPFVDRRGRLKGNLLAIKDLVSGRLRPERAGRL
ncbi:glycosyltransferase [Acuticoccus sp. M5D2P5]|uniref:glycosyltransferase family 2 protein n=1 Tax=Acuticoccus kalidii TaxID=2910977 RepID=UPI001F1698D8|nr:glycosyltransferase [Acuticoccus kalidii]MCF3935169.1 glycosyltransferase [Acuticoccus kalidii]